MSRVADASRIGGQHTGAARRRRVAQLTSAPPRMAGFTRPTCHASLPAIVRHSTHTRGELARCLQYDRAIQPPREWPLMAGTKKKGTWKKKTTRKAARRKTPTRQARSGFTRFEQDLPPNLRDFSRRVRVGLSRLERDVGKAQARTRRQAVRLLREASHALGRFEAKGERRWRKLANPARHEARRLLRRLEGALATPKRARARASWHAAASRAGTITSSHEQIATLPHWGWPSVQRPAPSSSSAAFAKRVRERRGEDPFPERRGPRPAPVRQYGPSTSANGSVVADSKLADRTSRPPRRWILALGRRGSLRSISPRRGR